MKKIIALTILASISLSYAGTLTGNVTYEGKLFKRRPIKMDQDAKCGVGQTEKALTEDFLVNDGNFENVLIWIKDAKGFIPTDAAKLDQKGCLYFPHILPLMAGQELVISNSDDADHNVHSMAEVNSNFNDPQAAGGAELTYKFNEPEEPFYIKCDVHPWMKTWVLVSNNPYFAVTDSEGNYSIENIPPGEYEVIAWQEKFKMKKAITKTITIGADVDGEPSTTTLDLTFQGPKAKK